ncbi:Lathosterol oxidase [Galdieria sulphuraria]|nr:Lathosterol oxidase [Galdieria sulphuraria]
MCWTLYFLPKQLPRPSLCGDVHLLLGFLYTLVQYLSITFLVGLIITLSSFVTKNEIWMSTWSLFVMSAFTTPMEVLVQLGYSKVYHRVEDYGWFYLIISPFLFVFFSDTLIYFIHLGLHHRLVYKHLHKPHHSFIDTTPFAAFAFHPIDGFLQGVPYQLYVFCLPIHASLHLSYSSYSWCEWSRTSSCSSQDL